MEKVHGKQLDAKALEGVRFSIPFHEGFSMAVVGGKLELNLPASALGVFTAKLVRFVLLSRLIRAIFRELMRSHTCSIFGFLGCNGAAER